MQQSQIERVHVIDVITDIGVEHDWYRHRAIPPMLGCAIGPPVTFRAMG